MANGKGVVQSEMGGAWPKPSMSGSGTFSAGPGKFGAYPRAGGGTPVKVYDTSMKTPKMPTPTQTAGRNDRTPRPGTKQRKYGTSDT